MSAILGVFYRDGRPVDPEVFSRMMQTLEHRGGDGSGTWINGSVALGHQMFHITPESLAEKLPLLHSESKVTITADARIDNRAELFSKLQIEKQLQESISDSELILHGYLKWGIDCTKHLLGEFSFAIWDDKDQRLILVRDQMGIRTLYYYVDANIVAFATEIKALFAIPGVPKKLNMEQFARHFVGNLKYRTIHVTLFEKIEAVRASQVCIVDSQSVHKSRYWDFRNCSILSYSREEDYLEQFREIFDDSVHSRMRSHFPIATLLSGGLDSSGISAVASQKLSQEGKQLISFAHVLPINYSDAYKDEREYIDIMRDAFSIDVNYIESSECKAFDNLQSFFYSFEDPALAVSKYVHDKLLTQACEKNIRVILDGAGGEFTATSYGLGYHGDLARQGRWIKLFKLLKAQSKIENRSFRRLGFQYVIKALTPSSIYQQFLARKYGFDFVLNNTPLTQEFLRGTGISESIGLSDLERYFWRIPGSTKEEDFRNFEFAQDKTIGTERVYPVQYSLPYYDRRLISFFLSVPGSMRIRNGWSRYLFRAAFDKILPQEICWRKNKTPFSPAHADIIKQSANGALDILKKAESHEKIAKIVDIKRIAKHWKNLDQCELTNKDIYTSSGSTLHAFLGVYAVEYLSAFEDAI